MQHTLLYARMAFEKAFGCYTDRREAEGSRNTYYQDSFLSAEGNISFYNHVGSLIMLLFFI